MFMIAQSNSMYKAAVDIQNIMTQNSTHKQIVETKFDSVLMIEQDGVLNAITAKTSILIPKNIDVVDLYVEGFQAGMKSIVDAIVTQRCKVILLSDALKTPIIISCNLDKDNILYGENGDNIACKFRINMILHIDKKDITHQQDVKGIFKNNPEKLTDIYLQGYFKGANLVLQLVSTGSLQLIYS